MSSRSDTVSIYLICMACKESGREKVGKGRKREEEREDGGGGNRRRYKIKVDLVSPKRLQHVTS